jgi:hypothetical protein
MFEWLLMNVLNILTVRDAHRGGGGRSEKLSLKNAIKHQKGKKVDPPQDFLATPRTPLEEFGKNLVSILGVVP